MSQAPEPSWIGLVYAALPALGCMALLAWQRLGQVERMALALARMTVQLLLLAVVLRWVFEARNPWIVGGFVLIMLLTSAQTVGARQGRATWELRLQSLFCLALGMLIVMAVSIRLSLNLKPWYDPRTVIPLLGMILGNSVNGVALAADRLQNDLRSERDRVELALALGATARQAALPALRSAVRTALTPILNNMMIAGIVAIPGMSTGQILAGADVGTAIRYQILVYLGITATVSLSTLAILAIRMRRYFTSAHQLRHDRLQDVG